jgi:hypothetical protein
MQTHHSYQHGEAGYSINETEHASHVELSLRWNGPLESGAEKTEAERVYQIHTRTNQL